LLAPCFLLLLLADVERLSVQVYQALLLENVPSYSQYFHPRTRLPVPLELGGSLEVAGEVEGTILEAHHLSKSSITLRVMGV
jgi:hypothetical protein